jgi:hypothetical protein
MWNNRMMSFRSVHYPRRTQVFRVTQEYAMRYYAIFLAVVMLMVVVRLERGQETVVLGLIGTMISIFLGNVMARVALKRRIAEIFFVNDGFSVINIHDILHQSPKRSFPLKFANPTRSDDQIQFHFEDQIMQIKQEDWGEDFELIWNWLNQSHLDFFSTSG